MMKLEEAIRKLTLDFLKDRFKAGAKEALPQALMCCFTAGIMPPEWVRRAWLKAYEDANKFKIKVGMSGLARQPGRAPTAKSGSCMTVCDTVSSAG
jgi:hypothetical protein